MTPRFILTFLLVWAAMIFGEYYRFLRGFDTSRWPASNWALLIGVVVAEAIAAAIMAAAIDKALPSMGNRAPVSKSRRRRRRSA